MRAPVSRRVSLPPSLPPFPPLMLVVTSVPASHPLDMPKHESSVTLSGAHMLTFLQCHALRRGWTAGICRALLAAPALRAPREWAAFSRPHFLLLVNEKEGPSAALRQKVHRCHTSCRQDFQAYSGKRKSATKHQGSINVSALSSLRVQFQKPSRRAATYQ